MITYTPLIGARGQTLQLFDVLRLMVLLLNVITYSAVISACGKCWVPVRALQLFDQMQQQRLEPNVITCTAVVSAGGLTSCPMRSLGQMPFQMVKVAWPLAKWTHHRRGKVVRLAWWTPLQRQSVRWDSHRM